MTNQEAAQLAKATAEMLLVIARGLDAGYATMAELNAALQQIELGTDMLLRVSNAEIATTNATGAAGVLEALEKVK